MAAKKNTIAATRCYVQCQLWAVNDLIDKRCCFAAKLRIEPKEDTKTLNEVQVFVNAETTQKPFRWKI